MNAQPAQPARHVWRRIWLMASLVVLLLCLSPLPAQAVTVSSKLEEQVLQVLRQHPEVILESVQAYQQQQQTAVQQARQSFLYQMQSDPQALIGQSPTTGSVLAAGAAGSNKILLVEFADFQCSFCAKAHPAVKQFISKHKDQVVLVYKNFPIPAIHPEAMASAKAAWAANQQGKFWDYYDALYSEQEKLGEAFYLSKAEALGLDMEQFERDRNSAEASQAIAADVELAETLQIEGTPFFALKDRTFSGAVQITELEQALALVQPA
jgi:protein-disulfide isomerase